MITKRQLTIHQESPGRTGTPHQWQAVGGFGNTAPAIPPHRSATKPMLKKSVALTDLIVVFTVSAVVYLVASHLNLFEAAVELVAEHENWQLDEFFVLSPILVAALAVYSLRRWKEYRQAWVMQEQASQAFSESEERYRLIAENSLTGIFISQDDRLVYINQRLADILGYDKADLLGGPILLGAAPEDLEIISERAQAHNKGEPPPIPYELRLVDKQGKEIWLAVLATLTDYAGKPAVIGNVGDITEQKKAEEDLAANEAWLRETGRMAKVGGWEFDPQSGAARWTGEVYRIHEIPFGTTLDPDEALSFFHPEDRGALKQAVDRAINYGEPYDMELRFTTAKGRRLWTRSIGRPLRRAGRTVKLVGSFQDITDLKLVQESLERETAVNRALVDLSVTLLSSESGDSDIANSVLEKAIQLTNSRYGYVSEIDESTGENKGHTARSIHHAECQAEENRGASFPKGASGHYPKLWGHSLNFGRAFFTNSPSTHPSSEGVPQGHIPLTRLLSAPVTAE